ncbi:unnamed protein product [Adineta ricciae]|uniref:Uncharacterized protein n=1 Tax=Adineta ricciae TaxID=249248 RepID=A0A815C6Y3_ADIRI|nr:unnamed protein product [Adineta ricciae]CAF1283126.1 unnamed protein product [Adineta ricciae]
MPTDATIPYEADPTHLLIWLDREIGNHSKYQHLKKSFSTMADPKNETPVALRDTNFDDILRAEGPLPINFEGVQFLLAVFRTVDPCIECFERNQNRCIYFIVSGVLGEEIIPILLQRFPNVFNNPATGKRCHSIYVFCHDIELQMDWAIKYTDCIQIFNFDADVLSRLVRDIADSFTGEAQRLLNENPRKNAAAKQRLTWAHILYQRYTKMESVSLKTELDMVNDLLDQIDEDTASSFSNEMM